MLSWKRMIPVFPGQEMWGAFYKNFGYIIVEDDTGFTATFKDREANNAKTDYLIKYENAVASFEEAKTVCETHLKGKIQ